MDLLSPGEIMEKLGINRGQLKHLRETRGIKPVRHAGIVGLFDEAGVAALEKALREQRARREKASAA